MNASPCRPMVLTWHSISDGPAPLCQSPDRFAAQLDLLTDAGYPVVSLSQIVERLERGEPSLDSVVALTFDDAYLDFESTALPILEQRGLPATLFVTASPDRERLPQGIDTPLLPLDRLAGLAERGIEIGGHSVRHADLTGLSDGALHAELAACRRILEQHAGVPVEHFAYPFGRFDARVLEAVGVHFRSACTVQLASVPDVCSPLAIPRIDAHYLRSWVLRVLLRRGWPEPHLRVRRWLRRLRGTEPRRSALTQGGGWRT